MNYLLLCDASLSAKSDDIESRARRNNVRIYGVREGEESNKDMLSFTNDLIRSSLTLPKELNLNVVRAHRSLTMKPKDPASPPRSIRFRVRQISGLQNHRNGNSGGLETALRCAIQRTEDILRPGLHQLKEKNIKAQNLPCQAENLPGFRNENPHRHLESWVSMLGSTSGRGSRRN